MTTSDDLERAVRAAAAVLARVEPGQLDDPTPCTAWPVRELINHLVGGSFFFAAAIETGTFAGDGPPPPDFASGDFVGAYADGAAKLSAALRAPDAPPQHVSVPFGEFSGTDFLGIATIDTLTHAWDLARATGQSTDLDPDLATRVLASARDLVPDAWRGDDPAPFRPEQPAPDGATAADRLAASLGRSV
ncbi:TIGR03086 family metal-binding protein [Nocardioides immobilis]|uniref:TIGR03086 family metal-binding protein n=1 Tax=Nocardioides immobilis TaxID=2049295 RepID=UPI0015F96349|nr:TIGR03086 family metal-binding protein [Nocardioides immobilis]